MEPKKIIILGVMAVMGIGVFVTMQGLNTPAPVPVTVAPKIEIKEVEYAQVLAMDINLPTGRRISEDMMKTIKWPAEALTANLIRVDEYPDAKADFINAIARQNLAEGETLTYDKIIKSGEGGIMSALLNPGMRAVTTRISVDTAAGGFIQPGDKVDIILRENFTIRRDSLAAEQSSIERNTLFLAKTLFENVKVLAIDQTFTTNPDSGAAIPGSTATFELSQSDSELLQEAEGYGDLYLTLRGVNGSGYTARSAAVVGRNDEDIAPATSTLTIYRSGEPTSVALQQRN